MKTALALLAIVFALGIGIALPLAFASCSRGYQRGSVEALFVGCR